MSNASKISATSNSSGTSPAVLTPTDDAQDRELDDSNRYPTVAVRSGTPQQNATIPFQNTEGHLPVITRSATQPPPRRKSGSLLGQSRVGKQTTPGEG